MPKATFSDELKELIRVARLHRSGFLQARGNELLGEYHAFFNKVYPVHAIEEIFGKSINQIGANDTDAILMYKLMQRPQDSHHLPGANPSSLPGAIFGQSHQQLMHSALRAMHGDMDTWCDPTAQDQLGLSYGTAVYLRTQKNPKARSDIVDDFHRREREVLAREKPFDTPNELAPPPRRTPLMIEKRRTTRLSNSTAPAVLKAVELWEELKNNSGEVDLDQAFSDFSAIKIDARYGGAANHLRLTLLVACIIAAERPDWNTPYFCSSSNVRKVLNLLAKSKQAKPLFKSIAYKPASS